MVIPQQTMEILVREHEQPRTIPSCSHRPGRAILDARALYPDTSLADLYDETTMPAEPRKAHQQNDKAGMQAYGFSVKDMTESKCVTELMKLDQKLAKAE